MKNTQVKYNNRYGDTYTFTLDSDGNVLWEGPFNWCRFGMPNDYSAAYAKYLEDNAHIKEPMSLEQFKKVVHTYDDETSKYVYDEYVRLVTSIKDQIDMIEPSGGPYISVGMPMRYVDVDDKKIIGFEQIEGGYKILLDHDR